MVRASRAFQTVSYTHLDVYKRQGHIYIDGIDIRQFSKKQLRSAIGQMQQDVFILSLIHI